MVFFRDSPWIETLPTEHNRKNYQGDNERQKLAMLSLYGSSVNKFDWRDIIMALTKMRRFFIAHQIARKKGKSNNYLLGFYMIIAILN